MILWLYYTSNHNAEQSHGNKEYLCKVANIKMILFWLGVNLIDLQKFEVR